MVNFFLFIKCIIKDKILYTMIIILIYQKASIPFEQNSRDIRKAVSTRAQESLAVWRQSTELGDSGCGLCLLGYDGKFWVLVLPLPFNNSDPRQATLSLFLILQMGVKSALGESNKIASDGANSPEMGAQRVWCVYKDPLSSHPSVALLKYFLMWIIF